MDRKNQYFTQALWRSLRLKFMVIYVAFWGSHLQQMCFIYTGDIMSRRESAQAGIPLACSSRLAILKATLLVVAPA